MTNPHSIEPALALPSPEELEAHIVKIQSLLENISSVNAELVKKLISWILLAVQIGQDDRARNLLLQIRDLANTALNEAAPPVGSGSLVSESDGVKKTPVKKASQEAATSSHTSTPPGAKFISEFDASRKVEIILEYARASNKLQQEQDGKPLTDEQREQLRSELCSKNSFDKLHQGRRGYSSLLTTTLKSPNSRAIFAKRALDLQRKKPEKDRLLDELAYFFGMSRVELQQAISTATGEEALSEEAQPEAPQTLDSPPPFHSGEGVFVFK